MLKKFFSFSLVAAVALLAQAAFAPSAHAEAPAPTNDHAQTTIDLAKSSTTIHGNAEGSGSGFEWGIHAGGLRVSSPNDDQRGKIHELVLDYHGNHAGTSYSSSTTEMRLGSGAVANSGHAYLLPYLEYNKQNQNNVAQASKFSAGIEAGLLAANFGAHNTLTAGVYGALAVGHIGEESGTDFETGIRVRYNRGQKLRVEGGTSVFGVGDRQSYLGEVEADYRLTGRLGLTAALTDRKVKIDDAAIGDEQIGASRQSSRRTKLGVSIAF